MQQELTLRQLGYFVAAADAGSMTAAAKGSHVSQSAVSLAISDLERVLGVQLFVRRRGRGLTLTTAGRQVLGDARQLVSRAEDFVVEAHNLGQALQGPLSVGCYVTIAPFLMPGIVTTFRDEHPEVSVDLHDGPVAHLQGLLRDGVCDLLIAYDLDLDDDIERIPIQLTSPYALLPRDHPLADNDTITLRELSTEPLVLLDRPQPTHYFLDLFESVGLNPVIGHRTSSFELVRSFVARGVGYSLLIQRPSGDMSYEGLPLVCRPLKDPAHRLTIVIGMLRGSRRTRRTEAFVNHCIKTTEWTLPASEEVVS
jgi:DNA-binding transcriptional LysR family regulator